MPDSTAITETALAAQLGVARPVLKAIRVRLLQSGEDYELGSESRAIEITPSGEKKIRAALKLPDPPAGDSQPGSAEKKEAGISSAISLTVVKAAGNRITVLCNTPDRRRVYLRVQDNSHFIAGMVLPPERCVHVRGDQFDYHGRLPKRRGHL